MKVTNDQVLKAIQSYKANYGITPSVRELGQIVGLKSPSTVQGHIERLITRGLLTRLAGKARTLQVIDGA